MHVKLVFFCLLLSISSAVTRVGAQEITLPYKTLKINADLTLAPGKTLADGVILIMHGGLAHRDMETIAQLREGLKVKGYNTLAPNLSLGLDNRHGMYDCQTPHLHLNNDAVEEIGVWMAWLKGQGVSRVALLGHSRGGAQAALYAAELDSPLVNAVVLLAPATQDNNSADAYRERSGKPLEPLLAKTRKLVAQGKGRTVLNHVDLMSCPDTSVTADTFVSYYGQDRRLDTPYLLSQIKKPTLVIVAAKDELVVGLDKKVAPLADGQRVQMKILDDADHFFRDLNADEAVEAIQAFLKRTGY